MSEQSRTGRLDLLAQEGLGRLSEEIARRLGFGNIREHIQPVIDRFVSEQVTSQRIPVTPIEIAEHMGLIKKQPRRIE